MCDIIPSMRWYLRLIEVALVLVLIALILTGFILYKPSWFPFQLTIGTNITVLSTMFAGLATLFVAYAAFRTIVNVNEQEQQRRELESYRRSLDDIRDWIKDVMKIKVQCIVPGNAADWFQRESDARMVASNAEFVKPEVERFRDEFLEETTKLLASIDRVSFILEHEEGQSLSREAVQKEVEDKIKDSLRAISCIKTRLQV